MRHTAPVGSPPQGKPISECSEPIRSSNVTTPTKVMAGEYTHYRSFNGHREAGMEGTLTVE